MFFYPVLAIFIANIFFVNSAFALKCYRGPLSYPATSNVNYYIPVSNKENEFNCPSAIKCVIARNCTPNPVDDKYYKLSRDGFTKIDEAECVKEINTVEGKELGPDEMCEKYYKPIRKCESCYVCKTDLCNYAYNGAIGSSYESLYFIFMLNLTVFWLIFNHFL